MALDPETVRRMEEVFGRHKCCLCGYKAQRMIKNYSGKSPAYFCHDCLFKVKPSATGHNRVLPLEARAMKVADV